jgi:nicotinamide-nucleotide amidase
MTVPTAPKAEILSIGSEILLGEIIDTNAAFLAGELRRLGFQLQSVRELPDDRPVIAGAFADARARSTLVVATGGLGPTHDDLTRDGLADALGETLSLDASLEATLRARMNAMTENNLRQAMLVPSALALANPIGSAPGWWVERDESVVVLMPGVPSEMRRMWAEQAVPRLIDRFEVAPLHSRTVKTFGVGESGVADRLGSLLSSRDPDAGIYARDDGVHVRYSTRGNPSALDELVARSLAILGDDVYGVDATTLPELALRVLRSSGAASLAVHEIGTDAALMAVLAAELPADDAATLVGGGLLAQPAVSADALLHVTLLPENQHGRSFVDVSMEGLLTFDTQRVRIHGSGPQRFRRAAFASLDVVRRAFKRPA